MRALLFANNMKLRQFQTLILIAGILTTAIGADAQEKSAGKTRLKILQPALDAIQADTLLGHIKKLASDEFEGREPGTPGEKLTVDYLVDQFRHSGAKP